MSDEEKSGKQKKTSHKENNNAIRKLSVQEIFYSDIDVKDSLYAVTIRSPIKHGVIISCVHPKPNEDFMLYRAKDVPGKNYIDIQSNSLHIFADDKISYLGEPIGILVGKDEKPLQEYQKELEFSFDKKTLEDYLTYSSEKADTTQQTKVFNATEEQLHEAEDAASFYEEVPIKLAERIIEKGDVEKAFESAEYVV